MKKFLKDKERDQLITQHRQEKDGRTRDRIKAVLMSDTGWTFKDIAEALLLDQETISRHVKEYREQQKLTINTGGSESKLSSDQAMEIIKHLVQEKKDLQERLDIMEEILHSYLPTIDNNKEK